MPYIDKEYYEAYSGEKISDEDFNPLAARASDIIDMLTMYKIGGDAGLVKLPPPVQEYIKKATAAQVEMMREQGGLSTVTGSGAESAMKSVSVGKFSYSTGGQEAAAMKTINGAPIAPLVEGYLFPTGLLYAGVCCCG